MADDQSSEAQVQRRSDGGYAADAGGAPVPPAGGTEVAIAEVWRGGDAQCGSCDENGHRCDLLPDHDGPHFFVLDHDDEGDVRMICTWPAGSRCPLCGGDEAEMDCSHAFHAPRPAGREASDG